MSIDQEKGFTTNRQENSPESARRPRKSRLTIMIIRGFGRVSTYNFSPHILLFTTIFFLSYFIVSIFFIQGYLHQRQANIDLDENLRRLEIRELERERALYTNRKQTEKLEAVIKNLEKHPDDGVESSKGDNFPEEDTKYDRVKTTGNEHQEEKRTNIVDIEDLSVSKEEGKLTVHFKLVKVRSGEDFIRGYIHVIAMGQKSDDMTQEAYPEDRVQKESSLDFRQGSTFRIQRFKQVKQEVMINPGSEPPSAIKILVFDKSGMLLLEKIV